jgi:hypothetical protein
MPWSLPTTEKLADVLRFTARGTLIITGIAVAVTALTYVVSQQALKTSSTLESPRLIAAIVALLSGFSLLCLGDGALTPILLPYAALGLALLLLVLLKWLIGTGAWQQIQRRIEDRAPRLPRSGSDPPARPESKSRESAAHPRAALPRED